MKIININLEPVHSVRYEYLANSGKIESKDLNFYLAEVDKLPDNIDAIVCTSDLQGVVRPNKSGQKVLLCEYLVGELSLYLEIYNYSRILNTAIILAGDLFVQKDLSGRGGIGFVDDMWYSFSDKFKWVAGVAGNHDDFKYSFPNNKKNLFFFDDSMISIDGISFGGISGIIGDSNKRKFRYSEDIFISKLDKMLSLPLDVLLLHQNVDYHNLIDLCKIKSKVDKLVIFGHKPREPFFKINDYGIQMLNVHEKVVIIRNRRDNINPKIIALDFEGTLVSNMVSLFTRPRLYEFLEFCKTNFQRIVIFTFVDEPDFRKAAELLVNEKSVPEWFSLIEYINWKDSDYSDNKRYKDLRCIPNSEINEIYIIDDIPQFIREEQKGQYIQIEPYYGPEEIEDFEFDRIIQLLK